MWVSAAIAGVAAVGGAVISSDASRKASNTAADAQMEAAKKSDDTQRYIYDTTRKDFAPFASVAPRALATIQSNIYGTPIDYTNEAGATETARWDYNPDIDPAFADVKNRTLADLDTKLKLMGRSTGTVAANATGRTLQDLNMAEAERRRTLKNERLDQLWNLVKTGQGAAGNIQGAGTNYANTVSSNAINTGGTLAKIALDKGETTANLYSGIVPTAANIYGTYKMGQYYDSRPGENGFSPAEIRMSKKDNWWVQ